MSILSYLFHSSPQEEDADLILYAPVSGVMIPLTEVPDVVISEKVVGDGLAFMPETDNIVAPCDGTISRLLATSNAFAIRTVQNLEIYVSFGIDAVDLQGEGMQSLVKVGDQVKKGDPILNIALNQIEDKIKSTITSMIVVKSSGKIEKITTASGKAKASNTPCVWVTLQKEATPNIEKSENPQT